MLKSFPVEISLGLISIQTWGFFVATGFILALWMSLKEAEGKNADRQIVWNVMTIALLAMIVGGRIFYFAFSPPQSAPVLFNIHSGFNLIGGAVLAGVSSFLYLKYKKQNLKNIFDTLTPGAIVALIFARIGCFLVNDHTGKITAAGWGVEFSDGSIRHPVALYHIIFLVAIFFIILWIKKRQMEMEDGILFFIFCFLYAFGAFVVDFSRCNDLAGICDPNFAGLTFSQWILFAFLVVSIGFAGIAKILKIKKR